MRINNADIIEQIEKHMQICELMEDQKGFRLFAKLINLIRQSDNAFFVEKEKKKHPGKLEFERLTSDADWDLSNYMIDDRIIENKDDLAGYWERITDMDRESFTIYNLNVLRYFISNQYNKYAEKKRDLVSNINMIVRNKRMENKKIVV